MTDAPLPDTDEARADLMVRLVRAAIHSELRELREADPAAIEQLAAGIQLRRLGWPGMTVQ